MKKCLSKLPKRHESCTQINKFRKKMRQTTKDNKEIQIIISSSFKDPSSTQLVKERDSFLHKYYLPQLNENQISSANWPVAPKDIEEVIKIIQLKQSNNKNKNWRSDGFRGEFNKTLKERLMLIFLEIYSKGTLPNSFYDATDTLMTKHHRV